VSARNDRCTVCGEYEEDGPHTAAGEPEGDGLDDHCPMCGMELPDPDHYRRHE
jgi:hypothetical protein